MPQRGCLRKGGDPHSSQQSRPKTSPCFWRIFFWYFFVLWIISRKNTMDPQKICLTIQQAAIPLATRDLRRCPSTHCHKHLHGFSFFVSSRTYPPKRDPFFTLNFRLIFSQLSACSPFLSTPFDLQSCRFLKQKRRCNEYVITYTEPYDPNYTPQFAVLWKDFLYILVYSEGFKDSSSFSLADLIRLVWSLPTEFFLVETKRTI